MRRKYNKADTYTFTVPKSAISQSTHNAGRIAGMLDSGSGYASRREIQETLGLSDKQYEEAADKLVDHDAAEYRKGRTGGLRLK